jgi:hypothetical protein
MTRLHAGPRGRALPPAADQPTFNLYVSASRCRPSSFGTRTITAPPAHLWARRHCLQPFHRATRLPMVSRAAIRWRPTRAARSPSTAMPGPGATRSRTSPSSLNKPVMSPFPTKWLRARSPMAELAGEGDHGRGRLLVGILAGAGLPETWRALAQAWRSTSAPTRTATVVILTRKSATVKPRPEREAVASVDWDMPSFVRRRRSFVPTCLSIGCATSLGIGFSSRLQKDTRVRARTETPFAATKAMLQCLDSLARRWHQRRRWMAGTSACPAGNSGLHYTTLPCRGTCAARPAAPHGCWTVGIGHASTEPCHAVR